MFCSYIDANASILVRGPKFIAKLDEAKAFIAEHGHMNVGTRDQSLYDWIRAQRHRRKAFPKQYRTYRSMTRAEIDALDAIGFDWGG